MLQAIDYDSNIVTLLAVWVDTHHRRQRGGICSNLFAEFFNESNVELINNYMCSKKHRTNRKIKSQMYIYIFAKLLADDSKWFKHIGQPQKAINSCINSSTSASLFEVMFGVKMNINMNALTKNAKGRDMCVAKIFLFYYDFR